MPLYYFHRRDTVPNAGDPHRELSDVGEALAEANRIVRSTLARAADPGKLRREALDIEDEGRGTIARVMFADVLRCGF